MCESQPFTSSMAEAQDRRDGLGRASRCSRGSMGHRHYWGMKQMTRRIRKRSWAEEILVFLLM